MKLKTFYGTWDSWGLEVSVNTHSKALTITLLHWYVVFELWTSKEIKAAENHKRELDRWINELKTIEVKPKKKPVKKAVKKTAKKPVKKAVKKATKKK